MTTLTQTLKGFRDLLPQEARQRNWVKDRLVKTFEQFGFEPLETPALEYAELLLGKYGAEADKLIYSFEDRGGRRVGLRYDQTVPSARVLAQYRAELPRYFRRYQMQNVFRADKPQRGRYREFSQCDIDIFGSSSSLADTEIMACTYAAFKSVGFSRIELRYNDRQQLFATLQPFATEAVNVFGIIQAVDKLDKISEAEVVSELVARGLEQKSAQSALVAVKNIAAPAGLSQIIAQTQTLGVPPESMVFTPTLARGLDYYTGLIFEVILPDYTAGSCGGGGRYDNLIGQISGQPMPAVGIAFGFDRMVEAADAAGLIPVTSSTTQVMVTVFNESLAQPALAAAQACRQAGLRTQLYPNTDPLPKQLKYADSCGINWVMIIGEREAAQAKVTLKSLQTGEQLELTLTEAIDKIKQNSA